MTTPAFTSADLDAMRQWDTPTICNGLELIVPERRGLGFTVDPLVAWDPALPPIVGVARVGTIRAKEPPRGQVADRADWYDYVARAEHPTIVVIQDIDDTPGYGAFWGEVNSALHKALGARGCVTNGSFPGREPPGPRASRCSAAASGASHAHVPTSSISASRRTSIRQCWPGTTDEIARRPGAPPPTTVRPSSYRPSGDQAAGRRSR
jgi:hypothetical protein